MRKILLNAAVSLDGFIEGPNGEYDWCFTAENYGMTDFLNRIDTIFSGRKSYELFLQADKNAWPGHAMYVFSKTIKTFENATAINTNIKEIVSTLKQEQGKDIWLFGGASLTQSLLNFGLLDELHLSIHPILLGKGKALFDNIPDRLPLKLVSSKSYPSGLVQTVYEIG